MSQGSPFSVACAEGADADALAAALSARLIPPDGGDALGFLYVTDALARQLPQLLSALREGTGVPHWTGSVGVALCTTGREIYDRPAAVAMIGGFPKGSTHILPVLKDSDAPLASLLAEWREPARFGVLHADPGNPRTPDLIGQVGERTGLFCVGGLTSSQADDLQIAGEVTRGGVSGALFGESVQVITAHTQGCTPIGPAHRITQATGNVLIELDNRPALDVFQEDIGEVLARDMQRAGGFIVAAFPVEGSDTRDYLVRNLVAVDTGQKLVAVGDRVREGGRIMFCRRDANAAMDDLRRMLADLRHRAPEGARGALYFSCLGRGRHQFGDDSRELRTISEELGDIPLVGFFANGEIFHNRLYGYTGVLTLFL
ncbi:histidine kinase [Thioalkalivibrio denitrificans]|uniref:Histidine kinase n=1 Tax=Thioalkalivibrio denitrificans TaxID=108003 RepID=A0A1V3NGK7_9GAMM|nr:FIST C-terminal domain-containing protein [Thioalkalivibrio denitrificans]OOG23982.1 histidine kinase [Thioalkalivibrio denitrificans]